MEWDQAKRRKDEHDLLDIEANFQAIYESYGGGYDTP